MYPKLLLKQWLAHPEVQVSEYSFAGLIKLAFGRLPLDVGAAFHIPSAKFSRTQSDSSPAYIPGLRLFAFPDGPAAAGAKEVALQGYRKSGHQHRLP